MRDRSVEHVRRVEDAKAHNSALRAQLRTVTRSVCRYEAVAFLEVLFEYVKRWYGNLKDYDVDGKLDSILDPHISNDKFRETFFVPSNDCLLYTSPSPRDRTRSRMPSSA